MSGDATLTDSTPATEREASGHEPVVMELRTGWVRWVYEATMIGLALTVAALLFAPDRGWVRAVNLAIWGVFVVDYGVRLALSTDRRAFVKRNVPDLVAILPLDFFRVARLARLARLFRLVRVTTILWRTSSTVRGILSTNGLAQVLAVSGLTVLGGGLAIRAVEPELGNFWDALWWAVVTSTTVGYGDLSPADPVGRIIAGILMLVGIGTIGMLTGSIATYFISEHEHVGLPPDIAHVRERLTEWNELSVAERKVMASILASLAGPETPTTGPTHE